MRKLPAMTNPQYCRKSNNRRNYNCPYHLNVCLFFRSCLTLIEDTSSQIQQELDLISSLAILDFFGVTILPLQGMLFILIFSIADVLPPFFQRWLSRKQRVSWYMQLRYWKHEHRFEIDKKLFRLISPCNWAMGK